MSKIKTKYSLREIVWYLFDNKIYSGRIVSILITNRVVYYNLREEEFMKNSDEDSLSIQYEIRPFYVRSDESRELASNTHSYYENMIYPTKQLLMKSL